MFDKNLGSLGGGKKVRKGLILFFNFGGLVFKYKSIVYCCVLIVGFFI